MGSPKLIVLEGSDNCINYLESYLGMEITEEDFFDPELLGIWGKIIKGAWKVVKGVGKGIGKGITARHRRKERERVAVASLKIKRRRAEKKMRYLQNVEKAKAQAARFFQMGAKGKPNKLLTFGLPLVALGGLWYMSQR